MVLLCEVVDLSVVNKESWQLLVPGGMRLIALLVVPGSPVVWVRHDQVGLTPLRLYQLSQGKL